MTTEKQTADGKLTTDQKAAEVVQYAKEKGIAVEKAYEELKTEQGLKLGKPERNRMGALWEANPDLVKRIRHDGMSMADALPEVLPGRPDLVEKVLGRKMTLTKALKEIADSGDKQPQGQADSVAEQQASGEATEVNAVAETRAADQLETKEERLKRLEREIDNAMFLYARARLEQVLHVGGMLYQCKEIVPHGEWESWVKERGFAPRTASNWMRLHKAGESAFNADMSTTEALKLLTDTNVQQAGKKPKKSSGAGGGKNPKEKTGTKAQPDQEALAKARREAADEARRKLEPQIADLEKKQKTAESLYEDTKKELSQQDKLINELTTENETLKKQQQSSSEDKAAPTGDDLTNAMRNADKNEGGEVDMENQLDEANKEIYDLKGQVALLKHDLATEVEKGIEAKRLDRMDRQSLQIERLKNRLCKQISAQQVLELVEEVEDMPIDRVRQELRELTKRKKS